MRSSEPALWALFAVGLVLVLASAIWVFADAKALGITKAPTKPTRSFEFTAEMNPAGWAVCVVLCWAVALPLYLMKRHQVIGARRLESAYGFPSAPVQVMPGWYPDPAAPGRHRWWDGYQWTEHQA